MPDTPTTVSAFLSRAPSAPPPAFPRFDVDAHMSAIPYHAVSNRIAAVCAYFNPHNSAARRRCWFDFAQQFPRIGLDLFTIEAVNGRPSETPATWRYDLDPAAFLFAKENLLNLAIARLPDRYDRVLWLDCDIVPTTPGYVDLLTEALDKHTVVQGFQFLRYVGRHGEMDTDWRHGVVSRNDSLGTKHGHPSKAYPGGAWAAPRELLAKVGGLYDRCVTGSGDVAWSSAVYGDVDAVQMRTYISPLLVEEVIGYGRRVSPLVKSIGFVPARCVHLYHGDRRNRQYTERHKVTVDCNYDPSRHVEYAENGTLRWSADAPALLRASTREYLHARREDD